MNWRQWVAGIRIGVLALALACGNGIAATAYGSSSTPNRLATTVSGTAGIKGLELGGLGPVAESTILAYEAGATQGADARQIGKTVTDDFGGFDITFDPAPANGAIIYVVANGGDAGFGHNDAIAEMTVPGVYCQGIGCQFPDLINITPVTTVATTAALQRFMSWVDCSKILGNTQTGVCLDIRGDLGLSRRVASVNALVNVAKGSASAFMKQTDSSPVRTTLLKLDTIANLLAFCIDSPSESSEACAGTFDSMSWLPTQNTLAAALEIASGPVTNRNQSLYDRAAQHVVFKPALSKAPSDWTVGGQTFILVANNSKLDDGNTLSAYAFDPSNGALIPVNGSPFAAGNGLTSAAINPTGNIAIVSSEYENRLHVLAVDPATGAVNPVIGSPVAVGRRPFRVTVDPTGRFVYVLDDSGIQAFKIDALGMLSPIAGSPFAADRAASGLTVDPSGKFVYVANYTSNTISGFNIDQSTGALSPIPGSPFADDKLPRAVVVDPQSRFAYVADVENFVSAYAIDKATGALRPIGGSPYKAGKQPGSVAIDPGGKFVYTGNLSDLSAYAINPGDGTLTAVPGSPFAAGEAVSSVTVDPGGKYLYATNQRDNTVSAYSIDRASGALRQVDVTSRVATGKDPITAVADPGGRFVYLYTFDRFAKIFALHGYSIDSFTGALSPVPRSPYAADFGTSKMAIRARFLYVPTLGRGIFGYAIDQASGALTGLNGSPFRNTFGPVAVTVHPNGKFLYSANDSCVAGRCAVSGYSIDPQTGALSEISGSPFAGGTSPHSILIRPDGKELYILNSIGNTVSIFNLDPANGNLPSPIDGSPFTVYVFPIPNPTIEAIGRLFDRFTIAVYYTTLGFGQLRGFTGPCTDISCSSPFSSFVINLGKDIYDLDVPKDIVTTRTENLFTSQWTMLDRARLSVDG